MKCDILFAMNSDLLYIIYMLEKRGVTELSTVHATLMHKFID